METRELELAVDSQIADLFPAEGTVRLTVSSKPALVLDQLRTERTGLFSEFEGVRLFIELRYGADCFGGLVPVLIYKMDDRPGFLELEPQAKATLLSAD